MLLILSIQSRAQLPDYHVRLFDESFGLRTAIRHVVRDQNGFIWLQYADRVQRFDGRAVTDFPFDDKLVALLCDNAGQIWVNSNAHIYRFVDDHAGFIDIQIDSSRHADIGQLFQLPGSPVWVQTAHGFFAWSDDRSRFSGIQLEELQLPALSLNAFGTFNNTLFVTTMDSVYAIDMTEHHRTALPNENVAWIYPVSDQLAIVTLRGNSAKWFDFQSGAVTKIDPRRDIENDVHDFLFVRDILSLSDHDLLVATHHGLMRLDISTRTFREVTLYWRGKPLEHTPFFYDLYRDASRDVWLVHGSGLIRFSPDNEQIGLFRNTELQESKAWLNVARNFAEDESGNLWVTTSQGFGYWNLTSNTMTMYQPTEGATDRLNQPSLRGIVYDGTNLIIGSSTAGIWLYNPKTRRYTRPRYPDDNNTRLKGLLENDFVRAIHTLPSGQYFIRANHLYTMSPGTYAVSEFKYSGIDHRLTTLSYVDSKKQFWLATDSLLCGFDSTMVVRHEIATGIALTAMAEMEDNRYLLGAASGLYELSLSTSTPRFTRAGFLQNISGITILVRDAAGDYWIASNDGLYRYDPRSGDIKLFDFADNIQGNVFSGNAWYQNAEGMLFLGGINGINFFHPDNIVVTHDSLQISLMKLVINNDDTTYVHASSPLLLTHSQNSIEVQYVAPYFGNTNRLHYQYRLQGYDTAWFQNGNTGVVRFTSLSPGRYIFDIAASIDDTHWYFRPEPLYFRILPPFWMRWWFILTTVVVLTLLLFIFVKLRIRRIRAQEMEQRMREIQTVTMNRDMATSRLTALRAQMNPHFIFNALNSIQRYILTGDVDQANKYLSKFSRLQREVLTNSGHDFITLEQEIEILELYLQLEQLRFQEKFDYTICFDPAIDAAEIRIPPMIIQPFVENAIWHGLMPQMGHKHVDIDFTLDENDQLHCRITDNGIGRIAASRIKQQTSTGAHTSKGFALVQERLVLLEQLYKNTYAVEIIDRVDPEGRATGTEVHLILHVGISIETRISNPM